VHHLGQEWRGITHDGQGRQTIGDDEADIVATFAHGAETFKQLLARGIGQSAPQVRPLQIHQPVRCRALYLQHILGAADAMLLQLTLQGLHLQRQMHRIARLRMSQLERQLWRGRQAHAAASQGDACSGKTAQRFPWIGGDRFCTRADVFCTLRCDVLIVHAHCSRSKVSRKPGAMSA
jgi:hypothetical protein